MSLSVARGIFLELQPGSFMTTILLLGAGKIGRMIGRFLVDAGDCRVRVGDVDATSLERLKRNLGCETVVIDAGDKDSLRDAMTGCAIVISALSYRFNPTVAQAALEAGCSYFDLTEDVQTTHAVQHVAERAREGQIFMPQSGLAPGFVSIVAKHLTEWFDKLDSVRMRVGALPQFPSNALKYNLTWSTDGLINEYCNPCEAIHDGRKLEILPLEGLEHFSLDGVRYEAFNTSGGLGTLCDTLEGRVRELNYKTIRYQGHRELMAFLLSDLRLADRRELIHEILESAIPITFQDVVVIFCTVSGWRNGQLVQNSDARKIYPRRIGGEIWSAIQISTAAGVCAVVDLYRDGRLPATGFVRQEQVSLPEFLENRFGRYFEVPELAHFADSLIPNGENAHDESVD
jgi:saccharopine dehydrogenase-like NADP-dependent oxidoreductase